MILDRLPLSVSGRPLRYYQDEVELVVVLVADVLFAVPARVGVGVGVGSSDEAGGGVGIVREALRRATVRLTSHRMLLCERERASGGSADAGASCSIPLYAVKRYTRTSTHTAGQERASDSSMHGSRATDGGGKRRSSSLLGGLFGKGRDKTTSGATASEKRVADGREDVEGIVFTICTKVSNSRPSPVVGLSRATESEFEEDEVTLLFVDGASSGSSTGNSSKSGSIIEEFVSQLDAAMRGKAWAAAAPASMSGHQDMSRDPRRSHSLIDSNVTGSFASKAGITGILRRQELEGDASDRVLEEAFQDLTKLMEKAKEMISLASKLREVMLKSERDEQDRDGSGNLKENQQLTDWLLQMGMTIPVTKESAGALFHQELARELADFIAAPLRDARGKMMTMTDVYCLVNRARGTDLVSPEDLIAATRLWPKLNIPFVTHTLQHSGALVIMMKEQIPNTNRSGNEEDGAFTFIEGNTSAAMLLQRLPQLKDYSGQGLSLNDIASKLDIALILAKEYVSVAEEAGAICRDEAAAEGVRFYHNFFVLF